VYNGSMKKSFLLLFILLTACAPAPTPTTTRPPSMPDSPFIAEPTPTPVRHNVTYLAFHDYNGNGEWEANNGEPLLPEITISSGVHRCTTGAEGTCTTIGVEEGDHTLFVNAPDNFRYFTPSIYEEIPVVDGFIIQVLKDTTIQIPLSEGP
jgi:hypothetical protein